MLWRLDRADFDALLAERPALARALARDLAERVALMTTLLEEREFGLDEAAGLRFGPYRVVEQLGVGGMAAVYSAVHVETGQTAAVKVLPVGWGAAPEFRERLAREAAMLQQVEHPNVIRVLEVGAVGARLGGGCYLAMEWLPQALNRLLRAQYPEPLPAGRALAIARGVAAGLAAVHAVGLVHRDVKTSNILLRADGTPVLTDFGLATALAGRAGQPAADGVERGRRHGRLRQPGAGGRAAGRRPERPLLAGRRPVRAADRAGAVRRARPAADAAGARRRGRRRRCRRSSRRRRGRSSRAAWPSAPPIATPTRRRWRRRWRRRPRRRRSTADAVSRLPARQPGRGEFLPRVRRPTAGRLRALWRGPPRHRPVLRGVRHPRRGRHAATSAAAPARPPDLEAHFAALQRAMPAALHDQLLAEDDGENRLLTILFADLTGSVQGTADLAPEDAADLVNDVLKAMVDAVLEYGGRINRLLGDAVLAFFGTPVAHENDPERAILAALRLRDAVQALGRNVTVGVNTGEVYLGAIGVAEHQEITAMGAAINLAARLREARPAGRDPGRRGDLPSHAARLRLPAAADRRQGLRRASAGLPRRAAPAAPGEGARHRGAARRPDRPRRGAGQAAADALDEVRQGRGQMVTLIGEAGVGKSRLVADLRQVALAAPDSAPRWLEGRCLDVGDGRQLLAVPRPVARRLRLDGHRRRGRPRPAPARDAARPGRRRRARPRRAVGSWSPLPRRPARRRPR